MSKDGRQRSAVASLLASLVLLVAVPVLAFEARSGGTVSIDRQEMVDGDLYAAGRTVAVHGSITGDLWAACRAATIDGVVAGSIMAAGETVDISGDVGHTVRAAGRTVIVGGDVEGDVLALGGEVNLTSRAQVMGDFLVGAGSASIDGVVEGDLTGGGGEVGIAGEVGGDVHLEVDQLTLSPTAIIQGDLTYTSVEEADIQPGAQIAGIVTQNLPEVKGERARPFPLALLSGAGGKVIGFLMALLAGLIIILLVPRRLTAMAESIRIRPGPSVGWGAIILLLTPIAAVIVCMTVVGIPVGLIALVLYAISIYLSQIPVSLLVGRWIVRRGRGAESRVVIFGAFALGLIILRLLRLIPKVGWLIGLAVVLFGLGAIVVTARRPTEAWEIASA